MMKENKSLAELQKTLRDVLNAHIDTDELSYAELIGVLELIKQEYIRLYFGEDKEEME